MGQRGAPYPDEEPFHFVTISQEFLLGRTPVTQAQWREVMKEVGKDDYRALLSAWHPALARFEPPENLSAPSHFKGDERPVEQVGWGEAAIYCNLRSKDEGLQPCYDETTAKCNFAANGYRLPTEAEWEYACRAGSADDYGFGADPRQLPQHGWFAENSGKTTQPVARKKPNAWGLFDMHGNVAEWCNDFYGAGYYPKSPAANPRGPDEGERYVLRGGAWNSTAERCRSAARRYESPGFQDACFARDAIGFRCVRRPPAAPKQ